MLLSRGEFRKQVFKRDSHLCVVCKQKAVDAHHIVDRKLWPDGGYYLDNGVSVCSECHRLAEETKISATALRDLAGIKAIIIPKGFSLDVDKWGKTPMYYKYPKTMHLPWSPNLQNDDRVIPNFETLVDKILVVTEKLDGENTTLYNDHIHARSMDSKDHPSRHWIKAGWSKIKHLIPKGIRVCGENMYAKHSIYYDKLESYFYVFGIFSDNICWEWDLTQEFAAELGFPTVPILKDRFYCASAFELPSGDLAKKSLIGGESIEGFVVRNYLAFSVDDWDKNIAKWVRKDHVQTDEHWLRQTITVNGLKNKGI